jgi:hypothetical protein
MMIQITMVVKNNERRRAMTRFEIFNSPATLARAPAFPREWTIADREKTTTVLSVGMVVLIRV